MKYTDHKGTSELKLDITKTAVTSMRFDVLCTRTVTEAQLFAVRWTVGVVHCQFTHLHITASRRQKCWRFGQPRFLFILATFYGACAETAISELPATIMTKPLDSATPISAIGVLCLFALFFQKSAIFLFPIYS